MTENTRPDHPNSPEKSFQVVLWGASQVGKTTTLAAYLGKYRPTWIDRQGDRETRDVIRNFQKIWTSLRQNQLIGGTIESSEFILRRDDGSQVCFLDIKGGNSQDLTRHDDDAEALANAHGAIIFVEWPGVGSVTSQIALENALLEIKPDIPTALVITKCECYIELSRFAGFSLDPIGYAKENGLPEDLIEIMLIFQEDRINRKIFPISVYGWSKDNKRPAHFYDEFGRLVPWNIRPSHVDRPFDYVLSTL